MTARMMMKMCLALQQLILDCVRFVMIRRLSASSFLVDMREHVKSVPPESKIQDILAHIVVNQCRQLTEYIFSHVIIITIKLD